MPSGIWTHTPMNERIEEPRAFHHSDTGAANKANWKSITFLVHDVAHSTIEKNTWFKVGKCNLNEVINIFLRLLFNNNNNNNDQEYFWWNFRSTFFNQLTADFFIIIFFLNLHTVRN